LIIIVHWKSSPGPKGRQPAQSNASQGIAISYSGGRGCPVPGAVGKVNRHVAFGHCGSGTGRGISTHAPLSLRNRFTESQTATSQRLKSMTIR
jgi:hypothetical protein